MMILTLVRDVLTETSTVGQLFLEGTFECYTLEDTVRLPGVKVPGETAIPAGVYPMVLDFSQRFQRTMPHVVDVPGFTGIRLHPGNAAVDTSGCILVGLARQTDWVSGSRFAFDHLFARLQGTAGPMRLAVVTLVR